jgi:hypothetical protein
VTAAWRAQLFDRSSDADVAAVEALRSDPSIEFVDRFDEQIAGLRKLTPTVTDAEIDEPGRWVYYPWRRTVVSVLGPASFRRLRLDRNRNKISADEQEVLQRLKIGVVGLSVGHAIAHSLALDGVCGELRLADFDEIELSNLNRVPASLLDLGVNKTVVAARRIAELDPYLTVTIDERGFTADNAAEFVDGLDLVVEECDSLDVKFMVREAARAQRIPVVMETSDRGLIDVERYDLEPDRQLFHGLLGDIDSSALKGLSTHDKVPYVLAILGAEHLSARMAASMIEVERTISTWPQLGSEVALGGASVAAAVRRFGLGAPLASGRTRIHLDELLDTLETPEVPEKKADDAVDPAVESSILEAARRAPSGGNVQPWHLTMNGDALTIAEDPGRTTGLDVKFRGTHVAVGAALFNAKVAAAKEHRLGPVTVEVDDDGLVQASLELTPGTDDRLSARYDAMLARNTNRILGTPSPVPVPAVDAIRAAAKAEGGDVVFVTERSDLAEVGEILAASDTLRYLSPTLHSEMMSELRWPGDPDPDAGIDVRSLAMDPTDLVKLDVVRRPEVMDLLASWDTGDALGDDTRDRLASSSAVAVVVVNGTGAADFVRGGSATESAWIAAEEQGLAVHPVSPVFIYAHEKDDFVELSNQYADRLSDLQDRFRVVVGLREDQAVVLILRLAHSPASTIRSRRRTD